MSAYDTYFASINGTGGITLIGGWELTGASGNSLDSVASHPAVWVGSPTYGATALSPGNGTSMDLDGVNDTAQVADFAALDIGTADVSMYAVFATTDDITGMILNRYDPSDGGFDWFSDGTNLYCRGFGANIVSDTNTNTPFRDSAVHDAAVVIDRSSLGQIWIDGAVSGTPTDVSAGVATDVAAATGLDIGSRASSGNGALLWKGRIGHIWIMTGLLTATQLGDLHTITTTGAPPGSGGATPAAGSSIHSPRGARPIRWRLSG